MDTSKLTHIGTRLFHYEIGEFLIGVSSGKIVPSEPCGDWIEYKKKAQCNQASEQDIRTMVEMSHYEPLAIVYEFMDEIESK